MPRKTKQAAPADARLPEVPKVLLDQFITGPLFAEAVEAVIRKLKKAIIERALGVEMSHHLGYPAGAAKPEETINHRNRSSGKTVLTPGKATSRMP